jgi:hypothetical protein
MARRRAIGSAAAARAASRLAIELSSAIATTSDARRARRAQQTSALLKRGGTRHWKPRCSSV